jgi:serine/threonine protein kinase
MAKAYADKEYALSQRFGAADPRGAYGIYAQPPRRVDSLRAVHAAGGTRELAKCRQIAAVSKVMSEASLQRRLPGRSEQEPYELVMQLARGGSLDRVFAHIRATTPELMLAHLAAFGNLVAGLDAYHRAGVAHLDIKPENVVCVDDPLAPSAYKFIDFGLSSTAEEVMRGGDETLLASPYWVYPLLTNVLFQRGGDGRPRTLSSVMYYPPDTTRLQQQRHVTTWTPRHRQELREDLRSLMATYGVSTRDDDAHVRLAAAAAADVYGLGVTLCYVVYALTGSVYRENAAAGEFSGLRATGATPARLQPLAALVGRMLHAQVSSAQLPAEYAVVMRHLELRTPRDAPRW